MHMTYMTTNLVLDRQESYFPVTLSDAPCLKNWEDGCISSSDTNSPDFIADDAIKPNL